MDPKTKEPKEPEDPVHHPLDRIIQSSWRRSLFPDKNIEASTILALNDAAVRSGKGVFLFLPELYCEVHGNQVVLTSDVPCVLYAPETWEAGTIELYNSCMFSSISVNCWVVIIAFCWPFLWQI